MKANGDYTTENFESYDKRTLISGRALLSTPCK